jgi:hypothetical protein
MELHDSINDNAPGDDDFKRRSMLSASTSADWLRNGTVYWDAYSFMVDWTNLAAQTGQGDGGQVDEIKPNSGASAIISTRLDKSGRIWVSARADSESNIRRSNYIPIAFDKVHDQVRQYRPGTNGFLKVWLDGIQIVDYSGTIGGLDNLKFCFGPYYGSGIGLNRPVHEYGNIIFPSTASLIGRTSAPLTKFN